MTKSANEPAFPQTLTDNQGRMDAPHQYGWGGLTKREYFAGVALQGLLAQDKNHNAYQTNNYFTKMAIGIADSLLAGLETPQP